MRILATVVCSLLLHGSTEAATFPWGARAVAAAQSEQKPILLIISTASCHECGAVAPDPEFVTVELNADEHPRVAAAYASYARAVGRDGSFPIQLALTPYLDPLAVIGSAEDRRTLVARWKADRDGAIAEAGLVMRRLRLAGTPSEAQVDDTPIERARTARALLRSANADDRQKALAALRAMTSTPLFDLLGGGFHHAARDAGWTMPRFEKLLRDQAEIAIAYTEAWQIAPEPAFEEVARLTLDLIARDFFDVSRRAFATGLASDALVPRRGPEVLEGGHYVWRFDEIRHLLGPALADRVAAAFGLRAEGNVPKEFDPRGDFEGRNVFHSRISSDAEIRNAVELLREVRAKRPLHLRDPRVITEYNALAISALARGGAVFGEQGWVDAAGRAARQYLTSRRVVRSGEIAATRPDYDALVQALIDMYEVTFDPQYLERAVAVHRDGAAVEADAEVPAAVRAFLPAAGNGGRLAPSALERIAAIAHPAGSPVRQLVILGPLGLEETQKFLRIGRGAFLPPRMVLVLHARSSRAALGRLMPWLSELTPVENQVTATVCQGGTCRTPTTDPATVAAWLSQP